MRRSRFLFLFMLVTVLSIIVWGCSGGKKEKDVTKSSSHAVIDETFKIIQERGVHPVNEQQLVEGALRGAADVIGDPYSTYFTEEEAAAHKESLASERIGIGAEITRTNGKFVIVAPIKSSPADVAGLKPYDEIVRIDGERLSGDSLQDVVKRLKGKKGTAVSMTIYRPDLNKHLEVSITRDAIPMKTVTGELLEEKGQKVGYISITTFAEETAKEWALATDQLLKNGAESLIIDVRGNPGGYLFSVGAIAGSLLQEDSVFAFMEDSTGALTPLVVETDEEITFNEKLKTVPVVLLQDQGSASASEVLSGALKDLKRGMVIGTNSFGKGTVQETIDLSNGGEVKLSTHKWLTPKEKWIHGKGVEAELEVEQEKLFSEHIRGVVDGEYQKEQFHDDIAYAQRLLKGLGYEIERVDGYFDEQTVKAVQKFHEEQKDEENVRMNRAFFSALKEEVEKYQNNHRNDKQLQMSVDYLVHEAKKGK